jgi:hypothetical protein
MKQPVVEAVEMLTARLSPSVRARRLSLAEGALLRSHFGDHIPDWYIDLLCQHPLANRILQYRGPTDTWDLWLADADVMKRESADALPGQAIRRSGYIPVAIDPTGSGNPYFVRFDSADPPILQILHDRIGPNSELLPGFAVTVCNSLSGFLRAAILLE